MKKKDLKVIIPVAVLALALFILAQALPKENKQSNAGALTDATATQAVSPTQTPVPSPTAQTAAPAATATEALSAASPVPTLEPAQAYLKVQIGNLVFEPLALTESRDLELTQPDGKQNVVRITPGSIVMHSANCDNQDCVHQGMVSLENKNMRVLQNMIVCLPNQVVLQLLDPEEALVDWESAHGPLPEDETL